MTALMPEAPPIGDDETAATITPSIPHSREAEEAVIGSVFINPDVWHMLTSILVPEDFYIHRHRWIWESFLDLDALRRPMDLLTVGERLDDKGQLQELGGPAYLTALINQVPTSLNAKSYARIVEAHSVRRKMIKRANDITELAYDFEKDIDSTLYEYGEMTRDNEFESSFEDNTQSSDVVSLELLELIESGTPTGVLTGFPNFDSFDALGGHPIGATLLIGDSSFGKSCWELQKCEQIARHFNKKVIYFGFEARNVQNVIRRVSGLVAGIDHLSKKIRSAALTAKERDAVANAVQDYQGSFGDPSNLLFNFRDRTLRGIERAIRKHRPAYVTVDQINQITDVVSTNPVVNMLAKCTKLKEIGDNYNCAISIVHAITAEESRKFFATNEKAQKSKGGQGAPEKNRMPDINAIPWATQMKFIADVVLFLVPEVNQQLVGATEYKINIWIMKDRDGDRFVWTKWKYDLQKQWFTDLPVKRLGKQMAQVPSGI